MRSYSRESWTEAQSLWEGFSPEWRNVRHQAAMRGILYPPAGTKFDSWDDDSPSQRAMLIRAIRETPALLERCVARSSSWSEVIAKLMQGRDEWRSEQHLAESRRVDDKPTDYEAQQSIAGMFERVAESLGYVKVSGLRDYAEEER